MSRCFIASSRVSPMASSSWATSTRARWPSWDRAWTSSAWAIDLMGGYMAGETVLVLGPGPIGLMAVQLCKAMAAERVILSGTRDERLEIGRKLGADHIINVRRENLAAKVS